MFRVIASILLFCAGCPSGWAAVFRNWSLSQEREINAGLYARLLFEKSGWRLWRFETRSAVTCIATKAAGESGQIVPLGVDTSMYGGTPRIEVTLTSGQIAATRLEGANYGAFGEYRLLGARFWNEWKQETDVSKLIGQKIEIHTVSYEYPAILQGKADEYGVLDLIGINEVIEASKQCD